MKEANDHLQATIACVQNFIDRNPNHNERGQTILTVLRSVKGLMDDISVRNPLSDSTNYANQQHPKLRARNQIQVKLEEIREKSPQRQPSISERRDHSANSMNFYDESDCKDKRLPIMPTGRRVKEFSPMINRLRSRSASFNQGRKRGKRGEYRKYDESLKARAIQQAKRTSVLQTCKDFNIPAKNLKRWMQQGPIRRKGGRKTQDPEMEENLSCWIAGYQDKYLKTPTSKMIKEKALQYSQVEGFKASKGWLEKFLLRQGLTLKVKLEQDSPRFLVSDQSEEEAPTKKWFPKLPTDRNLDFYFHDDQFPN